MCKVNFVYREADTVENSRVMRSMLFDFYGELLTDKQRELSLIHI